MPRPTQRNAAALNAQEYRQLAAFRYALRRFLQFSESAAKRAGLTAQHYQAMLAVCANPEGRLTVNELAHQLFIRHNSAVGLVDRLSRQRLVTRERSLEDGRKVYLHLTTRGNRLLRRLAEVHREELRRIAPQLRQQLQQIAQAGAEPPTS